MPTYDGNELREAVAAKLAQRWDVAADNAEMAAIAYMREAMKVTVLDTDVAAAINALFAIPRSTDPAIVALIESHAVTLESKATQTEIASQVAAILP